MNTAVAFIIFKRPDTTQRVFEAIRRAQPPRLYVIADGARHDKAGEAEAVATTRSIVANVDWPCEVINIFSEQNLGCKQRVFTGLNEVFTHETEAIILEDDCLPDPSFFPYCETLLERYRNEPRVMHIGANQFHRPHLKRPASYIFSRYSHCWGWATWRRAWQQMDLNLDSWEAPTTQTNLAKALPTDLEKKFWGTIFDNIRHDPTGNSSWAYPWQFSIWAKGGSAINSCVNLVENLGFGPDATHTEAGAWNLHRKAQPLGKLTHPEQIARDDEADDYTFRVNHLLQEMRPSRRALSALRIRLGALRNKALGRSASDPAT